jgi:trk system potassium uptake protein TrkH
MALRRLGSLLRYPARVTFLWYAAAVVVGALLLVGPFCQAGRSSSLSLLNAVFTATSAVCVTGLTVCSTGNDLSLAGQLVVLLLIQLGGIGIITVTTFVTLSLGTRQSVRQRTLLAETLGAGTEPDLRWILTRVIRFTLLLELLGAVVLTVRFLFDHRPLDAVWHAVFHSISAFCNAGFSLNDDSLMRYRGDPVVNFTVMLLVIVGGIGYPVMIDLSRNWQGPWRDRWRGLTLHSKMMLLGTGVLLSGGTLSVLLLEWNNGLGDLPWPQRVMAAMFHSVTCRTAGFNTLDVGALTNATLFISILLMIVGAGPCSTGGGFKVSTLAVLVLRGWSTLQGYERVHVSHRSLSQETINRAIATALLFAVVAILALTWLLVLEQSALPHAQSQGLFMEALFEVVSALGTVGLSTGMTSQLTPLARVIIIALMFIGRLGPITVFAALSRGRREQAIEYASEEPLIG